MSKGATVLLALICFVAGYAGGISSERLATRTVPVRVATTAQDSVAILAAFRSCAVTATWNVAFVSGDPLTLELRVCAKDFKAGKVENLADAPMSGHHEVLLIERRNGREIELLDGYFANLNFRRIEPGKLASGETAILWSASEPCGSCHSGPQGVLLRDSGSARFWWNEDWQDASQDALARALPKDAYIDEAESFFWDETRTSLELRATVALSGDPHCCPAGRTLSAKSIGAKNGRLTFQNLVIYPQATVVGD